MKSLLTCIMIFMMAFAVTAFKNPEQSPLEGAWKTEKDDKTRVAIFSDGYFSIAEYKNDEFINTYGGIFELSGDQLQLTIEYNAADPETVGDEKSKSLDMQEEAAVIGGNSWTRIDEGGPGELAGAWLITGRQRDGEMSRSTPGVRKTMKILSGTRFQWIAYNTETGEFFGTGGGTYTTEGGKYTENIAFFSRDNSRVGASLQFDYALEDGEWQHKGKSSRGEPLYEIWTKRNVVETAMRDKE